MAAVASSGPSPNSQTRSHPKRCSHNSKSLWLVAVCAWLIAAATPATADDSYLGNLTVNWKADTDGYFLNGVNVNLNVTSITVPVHATGPAGPTLWYTTPHNWGWSNSVVVWYNILERLTDVGGSIVEFASNGSITYFYEDVLQTGPTERSTGLPSFFDLRYGPVSFSPSVQIKYNVFIDGDRHVFLDQNATIESLNIGSNSSFTYHDGPYALTVRNQFNNAGTFRKTGDTSVSYTAPFHNSGTIEVLAGTLGLNNGSSIGGHFVFAGGGQVNANNFELGGQNSGTGNGIFNLTGTTIGSEGALLSFGGSSRVQLSYGSLSGPVRNTGSFRWTGGTIDGLTNAGQMELVDGGGRKWLPAGGRLLNTGTMVYSVESLGFYGHELTFQGSSNNRSMLTNEGTFNISTDAGFQDRWGDFSTGWGRVDNSGIFRKSGGTGTSSIGASGRIEFHNTGTVEVTSGTLSFNGGGSSVDADYVFANGGVAQWLGTMLLQGNNTVNGTGALRFAGGTINAAGDGRDVTINTSSGGLVEVTGGTFNIAPGRTIFSNAGWLMSGGTITGGGTLHSTTSFRWTGGTIDGLTNAGQMELVDGGGRKWLPAGGRLLNTGTMVYSVESLGFYGHELTFQGSSNNRSMLTNEGTFNISTDAGFQDRWGDFSTGWGRVDNSGIFRKSGGTGTSSIGASGRIEFHNTGTVEVTSGTLSFNGGFTQTAGATRLDGGNLSVSGTMNITGGTLTGHGTVIGSVSSSGIVSPGNSPGKLTISGNYTQLAEGILKIEIGGLTPIIDYDVLAVTGTANLAGTVQFVFINDFAPLEGDTFEFLTIGSTRTGNFTAFDVTGLLPGFEYDVTFFSGKYRMIALTDGYAIPEPGTALLVIATSIGSLSLRQRRRQLCAIAA